MCLTEGELRFYALVAVNEIIKSLLMANEFSDQLGLAYPAPACDHEEARFLAVKVFHQFQFFFPIIEFHNDYKRNDYIYNYFFSL